MTVVVRTLPSVGVYRLLSECHLVRGFDIVNYLVSMLKLTRFIGTAVLLFIRKFKTRSRRDVFPLT